MRLARKTNAVPVADCFVCDGATSFFCGNYIIPNYGKRGKPFRTRNSIFKNIGNKIRIEQAVKHDLRHGTL